ncbi:MAG: hypothetical protein IPJ86_17375 [Bacteroidetes bacterium]|nr:hypothetical protein [Bacteroidota bacterium]
MRLNPIIVLFFVAFLFSFVGLIISIVLPKSDISDVLMNFSLYISGTSGIVAVLFSKKLTSSKQWNYVLLGGALVVISFVVKFSGYYFADAVLKVSGGTIVITTLGYYVYLNRSDYRNNKWIWLLPLILLGCLFKYMQWKGANIIIFSGLLVISINAIIQLFRFKKYTRVQFLLFTIQLVISVCIAVFYFRFIKLDSIIIGYLFTWIALLDVYLQQENRFPESI